MDVHVLDRIWGDSGSCFIPIIHGWEEKSPGKYKAREYKEGSGWDKDVCLDALEDRSTRLPGSQADQYFCPVQFTGHTRSISEAVPELNVLWADLDDADPSVMSPRPTIAWHSSEHHYQALWILNRYIPTEEIEKLNRALSYSVGADRSGWDLTQLLRVPGSYNFKYGAPQKCELMWDDGATYTPEYMRFILRVEEDPPTPELSTSRLEDLIKGWKLNSRTRYLLFATEAPMGERSDRLWELEKLLVEAGLPVSLIVDVIKLTVWNKFAERKDGDKQLLAETLKAEKEFRLTKAPMSVEVEETRTEDLLTFDGFMEMDIPELDFIVEGFLQRASVGICAGEPKTMKSTLMLDMAVSVASGKPFLGMYKTKPVPVLYIQEENGEADIKRRFLRIAYSRRVFLKSSIGYDALPIPLYIMNNKGLNLQNKTDREFIDRAVEDNNIKLLILDPWYMMCGDDLNENDAGQVGQILKYLTTMRNRFGCTVILVHHFKKGEASRGGQRMRGSSVFHSWIECGLYSELNKGREGNIIMEREFRAHPSNKGLNIVFSSTDALFGYDVEVHDVSESYIKRVRGEKVEDDDVEDIDPEIEKELGEIDVPGEVVFDKSLMLKLVKAGTDISISGISDKYGVPVRTIMKVIKDLMAKGKIMSKVSASKITYIRELSLR